MMKKLVLIIISMLLIFPLFATIEEDNALYELGRYTQFDIILDKPGVTTYYFAEYGSDSSTNIVTFSNPVVNSSSGMTAVARVRFIWSIYNTGKYKVSLIFQSDETDASGNSWMLYNTNPDTPRGYNYSVQGVGKMNNTELSIMLNAPSKATEVDKRTLDVVSDGNGVGVDVISTTGNTGYVDLTMTLTSSGEGSFTSGHYKGNIYVNVDVT